MEIKKLKGNIDIFVGENEDEIEGEVIKWNEILIHGDPQGLKSLAELLYALSELNQDNIKDEYLPIGEREHITLTPGIDISESSDSITIGRLDAKKTGKFYNRYISKEDNKR